MTILSRLLLCLRLIDNPCKMEIETHKVANKDLWTCERHLMSNSSIVGVLAEHIHNEILISNFDAMQLVENLNQNLNFTIKNVFDTIIIINMYYLQFMNVVELSNVHSLKRELTNYIYFPSQNNIYGHSCLCNDHTKKKGLRCFEIKTRRSLNKEQLSNTK